MLLISSCLKCLYGQQGFCSLVSLLCVKGMFKVHAAAMPNDVDGESVQKKESAGRFLNGYDIMSGSAKSCCRC